MKILFITVVLSFIAVFSEAQDIEYKEYSYTEFFRMVEEEEDSVFRLDDALIIPDSATDSSFITDINNFSVSESVTVPVKDTVIISKQIILNNVQFRGYEDGAYSGAAFLSYLHFKKRVSLRDVGNMFLSSSRFDKRLELRYSNRFQNVLTNNDDVRQIFLLIQQSDFKEGLFFFFPTFLSIDDFFGVFSLVDSQVHTPENAYTTIATGDFSNVGIAGNSFTGPGEIRINSNSNVNYIISGNHFQNNLVDLQLNSQAGNYFEVTGNSFDNYVGLNVHSLPVNANFDWSQFAGKSLSVLRIYRGLRDLVEEAEDSSTFTPRSEVYSLDNLNRFANQKIIEDPVYYKEEQKLKGFLMNFYKSQNDLEYSNAVYVESKDLETRRLAYTHVKDPSFTSFFTLKINQFLKVFSAYGTEPAKAVVFSMYVILAFALIYLFFPNSWDSHGKDRIFHRYAFFMKYMRRNAGVHEVYLEEKKSDIMHYEEFKSLINDSEKSIPSFFSKTALQLYKWTLSGTRITSALLSKTDIMKGTWKEVPATKRWWKGTLLIGAFMLVLAYDLLIKMLNALMLSINTFTTLGFGEIPIKGLPRYLAIIQGFIGWFMLTIFSVSLISQLLN